MHQANTPERIRDWWLELSPRDGALALNCCMAFVIIYALEAPIRYGLNAVKLIQLILFRDLLMIVPLVVILYHQLTERRISPVLLIFGLIVGFQSAVFYLNYHATGPIVLGAKLLVNIALGLMIGASLTNATGRTFKIIAVLFAVTVAGLVIEKFVMRFPWVGMTTNIGGIEVPISMDWQVGGEFTRRVGGFTRISINAASLVPLLGLIVAPRCRSYLLRVVVVLLMIGGVFLTTQKGALLAIAIVGFGLLLPRGLRWLALSGAVISGMCAQVILPLVTDGMQISEGTGDVFSASSFAARVLYTWPISLQHLEAATLGPFGVGIGGLGGPMRLLGGGEIWMFADNMAIFLAGYLGIFALLFYGMAVLATWRSLGFTDAERTAPLAILGFFMWYGVVITGIEDQMFTLALGSSLGALLFSFHRAVRRVERPVVLAAE